MFMNSCLLHCPIRSRALYSRFCKHILFILPAINSIYPSTQLLGVPRDSHWYFDSSVDSLNSTDKSLVRPIVQGISRGLEAIVPNIATLDVVRVALAHTLAQGIVRKQ